jgi:hypothetical protein
MNWARFFSTPAPATGWSLDTSSVAVVRRDRKGRLASADQQVPEGAFEVGAVGLQTVDGERLVPVLQSLQQRVAGARRATVVVPMRWLRAHLLDLEDLPRKRTEIDEVVRWRLKKLLPVRPAELRLDLVRLGRSNGANRLLCLSGLERAYAALEEAFAAAGVQPALITPAPFALATTATGGARVGMVVDLEPGMLTVLLQEQGETRLLRTKPLPPTEELWPIVHRELRMSLVYIREQLGVDEELETVIVAGGGIAPEPLEAWLEQEQGVRAAEAARSELHDLPVAGRALLAPLAGLVNGGW